ncbi:hypothetical protein MNEG_4549 [Monoraphidium neglectum]|uniref:Uncharacterized protein n=1 Tax=Monoraphidium neglectum TaxID=145388 RepID=A0A0D2MKB9_9CHLO|nr:hypothetical protein MNEG_4549 [Monoraphidium neglectum]KIZ03410.1 hypothetical protein MNEG_4549 [Monoraphidium neglectum]|eukprot:XP_013902429.1 hypothetical protein MNEG_4549 [Monoraphidium neglectum]
MAIAIAAAAGAVYVERSQLNTVKEMMISEMQCLEVKLAAAEKTLSKDIEILKRDVQELKGGVKAILKNLDAKGK